MSGLLTDSFSIVLIAACLHFGVDCASAAQADDQTAGASAEQGYYSGNGLLKRGLHDLAADEYGRFLKMHPDHEKAPIARYGLAVSLFRLNKHEEAGAELEKLQHLRHFKYVVEVIVMLGQCQLESGRHAKAIKSFNRVVRGHANHTLADNAGAQLVEAYYSSGRRDEAISESETFITRWPTSPHRDRVDYFSGLSNMGAGSYQKSADRFGHLLKKYPKSPFATHGRLLLAQSLHHLDRTDAAEQQYRKVLKQVDGRFEPDALLGLGTLLRQRGRTEEAAVMLDRMLKTHPKHTLGTSARLIRGRVWFDAGRYEKALECLAHVAEGQSSVSGDAAYWAAKCKLRLEDYSAAANDLQEAISKYPDSSLQAEMRYDLAVALMRKQDFEVAEQALGEYRARFPDHSLGADALQMLATLAHGRKAYEKSESCVSEFMKRYASHKLAPKVMIIGAENAYLQGNYGEAARRFRRFLKEHGTDDQAETARYRLGMALYRQDQFEEAAGILSGIKSSDAAARAFPSAQLALGDIYYREGKWEDARRRFEAFLKGNLDLHGSDDALLKLGLCLQRLKQHDAALAKFQLILNRFKDSPHCKQALFERGQSLVALARLDEAVIAFEKVLESDGAARFETPARRHLAAICLKKGEFGKAARRYARIARTASDKAEQADALLQQGRALMAAHEFPAAEKALRRFVKRFATHSQRPSAQANLAIAAARQDRHADALELMKQIDAGSLDGELKIALLYERAWCQRTLDRTTDAAKSYRRLIGEKGAGDLRAHALLELADIEATAGKHTEAVKLLRQLSGPTERDSKSTAAALREQAIYRLGTCLFHLEDFKEAAKVLSEFVETYSQSKQLTSASWFCGEALFKLGRHDEAIVHFQGIVNGDKEDPARSAALLRLGECCSKMQQWARSEEAFSQYLDAFSKGEQWFQAQFGLGWARENQGRYGEAREAYERVVARHKGPTAARAQFQIGQCLFAEKKYEDAARQLMKVDILYEYPEWSAAALYEAGRCFESLSRYAEAQQQFEAVIKMYKDTRWAELASQRMSAVAQRTLPGR